MNKMELAEYLVNLSFLMDARQKNGSAVDQVIAAEYQHYWATFEDMLKKGQQNEQHS